MVMDGRAPGLAVVMATLVLISCETAQVAGLYRTTAIARDTNSCVATTAGSERPHFELHEVVDRGYRMQVVRLCLTALGDTCAVDRTNPVTYAPLTVADADGWYGQLYMAQPFADNCRYLRTDVTASHDEAMGTLTLAAQVQISVEPIERCDVEHGPADWRCRAAQTLTGERIGDVSAEPDVQFLTPRGELSCGRERCPGTPWLGGTFTTEE